LDSIDFWIGDEALVGDVDAVDLDLGRLLVEQVVELALGELAIGLSGSKKPHR
jgi:hypothetical protein